MTTEPDTIFALSSGRLPAAIAVVRVSGPHARDAVMALAGRLPVSRQATLARLRDADNEAIDDALMLWFPAPHSETGEDTAELQLHGGRAVVAAILAALGRIPGLRVAEAGEFTRRAFANGKLDLTRVEGLADLIGAETEAQRRQAFGQLKGLLGDNAERWRGRLVEALALVEALIDFPDEGGVPHDLLAPALAIAAALETEMRAQLADERRGERLREGLMVAITGPVNVGKSSILNRLARRSVAIVSPVAGTTRDAIEVHLDLGGYPVTLVDTAGMRDTGDPIEQEGMRRAGERAAEADLVLWVVDATEPDAPPTGLIAPVGTAVWVVANKRDLVGCSRSKGQGCRDSIQFGEGAASFLVSALTGAGFDEFTSALRGHAAKYFGSTDSPMITRKRHREILMSCAGSLSRALAEGASGREDIIAEELRLAGRALGRLTGRVDVDEVLDVIFRDFCIGK